MYPITISLEDRRVLVVGGGTVGERRTIGALDAGARVTVVAPETSARLRSLRDERRITLHERPFDPADVAGAVLVFACTDSRERNDAVLAAARAVHAWCNDAIDPDRGDFVVPAVHRSGPVTFAVDSGGASPSFARRLRRELAERFDARYAAAAERLAGVRAIVKATVAPEYRAAVMNRIVAQPIETLAAMHLGDQENAVEEALAAEFADQNRLGAFKPQTRICATRRSALALVQTRQITARLARVQIASTLLELRSTGDRVVDRPLPEVGIGVFTGELEAALADRRADYAVHSCKDLPGRLGEGLCIAAVSARADARDAFCSERHATFASLPPGARVGTSSPRRRAQLAAMRSDLDYVDIRGNIDTRLRRLAGGEYDAIVLAAAGLARLGVRPKHLEFFDVAQMVPAVGQGALAVEARDDDQAWLAQLHEALSHRETELAVVAERAFLAEVRGGCHAPIGAHGVVEGDHLRIDAVIAALDGSTVIRESREVDLGTQAGEARRRADEIGREIARALLERGGSALVDAARRDATPAELTPPIDPDAPLRGRRILLGRTQDRPSRIAEALRGAGAEVFEISADDEPDVEGRPLDAILFPSSGSVAVVAAHTSALFHTEAGTLIVAMGGASAEAARAAGFVPQAVAPRPDVPSFVQTVAQALLER